MEPKHTHRTHNHNQKGEHTINTPYQKLTQKHKAPQTHKLNIICTNQENKSIRLIPIPKNKKYPQTKNWTTKIHTLQQLTTHNGNYGIMTGWNHNTHGYSLACIDIDGLTIQNQKIPHTTEYLFQTLWKHIKGDKRFEVHKSPNGYHIFWRYKSNKVLNKYMSFRRIRKWILKKK